MRRILVINADDFGQSSGVNEGVIHAHRHGIVTSASLMVRWPAAGEAVACARRHPALSLGLHVDLGEWTLKCGTWESLYEVVPLDDADAVRRETGRQLETFRRLTGGDPTHLDSHQHVHLRDPARGVLRALGRRLRVPLRHFAEGVRYHGHFYGQSPEGEPTPASISASALIETVGALQAGVTELGCHPALGDDLVTMYGAPRALEAEALCDPRVRDAVRREGVLLRSFRDIGRVPPRPPGWRDPLPAGLQ